MTRARIPLLTSLGAAAAIAVTLAACSSPASAPSTSAAADSSTSSSSPVASASPVSGSITVFAAASLTKTFTELATQFEQANPGTTVKLNFAGSSDLVTQITEGAPADVFASADEKNMAKVTAAALNEGDPVDIATNVLEIAVPPGNPAGITDFASLAGPDVKLAICAPEVPCGAAAVTVEKAAGVTLTPVTEESSVTDVLGKVSSGEADAGLVYVTDVTASAGSVDGIEFDESSKAVNTYPIVALSGATAPSVAAAFVDFVAGDAGQTVLKAAGFGTP